MSKLGIGHLLNGGDFDFHDCAKEARESGTEGTREGVVEGFQSTHLFFGDAFGAFKVVGFDFGIGIDEALACGKDLHS